MDGLEPVQGLARASGSDVYMHSGFMGPADGSASPDDRLIALAQRPRQERAYLFVATYGGLARCAYRIMRSLRHAYDHVTVVVAGPCKSAGTLLVIGADEIVMTGAAELGPLDVQILKPDEIFERQSGLATSFAFQALAGEMVETFSKTFVDMKVGGRLTTSTAATAAAELAVGVFAPIYAQLDPMRVGEIALANLVASQYAQRLLVHEGQRRACIDEDAVFRLLGNYPSHDFAIDRTEAKTLFHRGRVRHPTAEELAAIGCFGHMLAIPATHPVTIRIQSPPNHDETGEESDDEAKPAPAERSADDVPEDTAPAPEPARADDSESGDGGTAKPPASGKSRRQGRSKSPRKG